MAVHTLRNTRGLEARVVEHGGTILSLLVPDRRGRLDDVVLGFDAVDRYVDGNDPYFGALIGRYANRIAHGTFTLDGRTYTLATNQPPHHLHGGRRGFDSVVWSAEPVDEGRGSGLVLRYTSPDGEEGYPGTLEVRVRYTLTDGDELVVDYHATTDRATPVNLTQHSYFNLAGGAGSAAGADVLDHVLTIPAERFTPVDETLIPTGELRAVDGTPFDFREPTAIGTRIDAADPQLRFGAGYDHNYVLSAEDDGALRQAARVYEPGSGRVLEIHTTEPGVQLYTGNHLGGTEGKGGVRYGPRAGLALETQHFPNSPNRPEFPSTIVRPGEPYRSRTVYVFTIADTEPAA